jgi:hypothetical protein
LTQNELLHSETTKALLKAQISTSWESPYTHYGYGVWIDQIEKTIKFFVEGFDPGVALRSAVYPDRNVVLTMIGNTADELWPLYREIEATFDARSDHTRGTGDAGMADRGAP